MTRQTMDTVLKVGGVAFAIGIAWATLTAMVKTKADQSDMLRIEAKVDALSADMKLIKCHVVPATLGCPKP